MSWFGRIRRLGRALVRRSRFEREMAEELSQHMQLEIEDRVRSGMTPAEARRTALRDFGGVERWKEEARSVRGLAPFDAVRQDLRYAWRTLRGAPGFAAAAVATLALGIGATVAVFSVADALLLRPLAYPEPDRIVRLLEYREDGSGRGTISSPNFFDWLEQAEVLEAGALYDEYRPTLRVGGRVLKVEAASVGASYFEVLGVRPAVGRFFLPEEDEGGANRVVLSWGLWREAFGGEPDVVGRTIELDGFPYTVVGVAPQIEDPRLSYSVVESPRLWRSTPSYFLTNGRGGRSFTGIARLRPGVTLERAQAELSAIHVRLVAEYPDANTGMAVHVVSLKDDLVGGVRPVLWLLLASVGLVLLIACANVANLLLFRAAARGREIGVRVALGASRGRVVRQLMVESVLLALLGAAGGIALAALATNGLVALAGGELPRAEAIGIDLRVLGFAVAAAAGAALVFGLLPAFHTTRVDVRAAVGGSGRGASSGRVQSRLRSAVVATQVAMAVVVMLGAALLGRSLLRLQAVDPGIAADHVLVLRIDPPPDPYDPSTEPGEAALLTLYARILERLGTLPGVDAVGLTDLLPMSGSFNGNAFSIVGRPEPAPGQFPRAEARAVSPGFFDALGIPIVEGRGTAASDHGRAERVVVVDRSLVRRFFPDGGAIGARIQIFDPDATPARIVGIAGDVSQFSLDRAPEPVIYLPVAQAPDWMQDEPWIALRTAGDPAALTAAARAAVRDLEPRTPIYAAQPMRAVIDHTLVKPRFRTVLLLAFAGIAFLLAGIGVYGMVAYSVARRLPELGIRMAMGADARRILAHVLGDGLRPVLVGAIAGLLLGLLFARLLHGFLFGVATTDLASLMAAPLALIGLATLAAWLPARRAGRLSPARVLRGD